MLWMVFLLACGPSEVALHGPAEIPIDARPCEPHGSVGVETLQGARSCASCPCDVELILPSTTRAHERPRASATFVVSAGGSARQVRCSWASQWTLLAELAGSELGAAPVGVSEDRARLLWDDEGLRLWVPNGADARCADAGAPASPGASEL